MAASRWSSRTHEHIDDEIRVDIDDRQIRTDESLLRLFGSVGSTVTTHGGVAVAAFHDNVAPTTSRCGGR